MSYETDEASAPASASSQGSNGMNRRDALKRGALVGGAVLWAGPVVQNVGMSKAFGQTTTPTGTGISFIAFRFVCDGVTRFAKVEDIESATDFTCEGPTSPSSENCDVDDENAETGCGFFTLSDLVFSNGELVSVRVTLNCTNGVILEATTKCGFGNSGCTPATALGNTATFGCLPKEP